MPWTAISMHHWPTSDFERFLGAKGEGGRAPAHAPIPPPPHPTFDLQRVCLGCLVYTSLLFQLASFKPGLAQCVLTALEEDSAEAGDVTTLST